MEFRIELNIARNSATPVWHFLMEDDYSPCVFDTEEDAVAVAEDMTANGRVVRVVQMDLDT